MERMLGELSSIVPPSSLPVTSSLTSEGGTEGEDNQSNKESDENSEASNSIDRLALLRKRLLESVEPDERDPAEDSLIRDHVSSHVTAPSEDDESSATINILPPTPTVPSKAGGFDNRCVPSTDERTHSKTSLSVEDALIPRNLADNQDMLTTGKTVSESVAIPKHVVEDGRVGGSPGTGSSGRGSPCFSPGSLHNTPDTNTKVCEE